jgi:SAM-dependent methyltransferase
MSSTTNDNHIDWEKMWEDIYDQRCRTMRADSDEKEYWSQRAEDFSDFRSTNDFEYGSKVLEKLWGGVLGQDSVVLDVGAGPGTFVVPFARKVRRVDALEPAPGMVATIRKNTELNGIKNFRIIESTWQEANLTAVDSRYDLVIGSLVLFVFRDLWRQLTRMEQASRAFCCVVTGVEGIQTSEKELWSRLMGDQPCPWRSSNTEFPLVFNLLHSKGRSANVSIIHYTSERALENKVRHRTFFFQRYRELVPDEKQLIRDHYSAQARNGHVQETARSAVIWWPLEGF